ncbi:type II toxin-antitoxin system RelE/ParE family toxin [Magnetovibrio sp. PR-2]|uniref:type II toxin-antitoxin system RelE/ParE family toxin n=1 Tax=Magnetovibrio sp. PR-2 TaxID=3120356 RepID=UPI002FCE426C
MAKFILSNAADADLLGIARFTIDSFGPNQALTYAKGFEACFNTIAGQPHIGLARDEIRLGLRSFNYKSRIVFYLETDEGVFIVRVLHARQDPAQHLS